MSLYLADEIWYDLNIYMWTWVNVAIWYLKGIFAQDEYIFTHHIVLKNTFSTSFTAFCLVFSSIRLFSPQKRVTHSTMYKNKPRQRIKHLFILQTFNRWMSWREVLTWIILINSACHLNSSIINSLSTRDEATTFFKKLK